VNIGHGEGIITSLVLKEETLAVMLLTWK